jgi:effector-binding domain-containing protein
MNYPVRIETIQSHRPTAVVRRRANHQDLPKVVPELCGLVWNVLRQQQIKGAGRHVAVYFDNEINLEVGVELETPIKDVGEVVASKNPTGIAANTTHFGPYGQLKTAHQAIKDWCAANGYRPTGVNWEIYGHWQPAWNNDPSLIRTDVFYLVEKC